MKLKLRKSVWTEKRASIRLDLECPVEFRVQETHFLCIKKTGKPLEAMMLKPSMNGMRLASTCDHPVGTVFLIKVQMKRLGFDQSFGLQGRVMWSEFSGVTKKFEQGIELSRKGKDQGKWEQFVLSKLKETDQHTKLHTFNV